MATTTRAGNRSLMRRILDRRICYLFIAPSFILMALFSYYPFLSAIYHSFTKWTIGGVSEFIGLQNFIELIGDKVFLTSMGNLVKLALFSVAVNVIAPLFAAELIFNLKSARHQFTFRSLLVLPMVVPAIVTILVWGFIYDAEVGILNQFLELIGLGALRQAWLADERFALYALMGMGFPWVGGFALMIFLSGLQSISQDILDTSTVEGASLWQRFWRVDLPMVMGQVQMILILTIIGALQGFDVQMILTQGGPGYATYVPGLHMYNMAFRYARMGYASAIGVVLFLLILSLTYANMKSIKVETAYEAE